MPICAADKQRPLVTSISADAMLVQEETVVDIVSMCSGPDGCSVAVLLQSIAKGGLKVFQVGCYRAHHEVVYPHSNIGPWFVISRVFRAGKFAYRTPSVAELVIGV